MISSPLKLHNIAKLSGINLIAVIWTALATFVITMTGDELFGLAKQYTAC